jgi:DNA-binding beta-propeller fold protein YncE
MMLKTNYPIILFGWLIAISFTSCRKDASQIPSENEQIGNGSSGSAIKGLYLLNEGNMGSNKASLDFYDYTTGTYKRNLFGETNPDVVLGLGDVGNDIAVYGTKMYVVVNGSNRVVVLNARTAKRIKEINVPNCRYLKFYKNNAYITSYEGYVAVADTTLLTVQSTIKVGRQPEQMAIVDSKMYVANSGGYTPPDYDRTVSVIDLNTNAVIKSIDVAINLNRIVADRYGDVYVTSRGDYYDIQPKLFVIDSKTDAVKKQFDIPVTELTINNDLAYIYSVTFNYKTSENTIKYALLDIKTETLLNRTFITDGTEQDIIQPYGLAVDPLNEDVYITDARDYISSGKLYCYDKYGKKKWSVFTGDIPAHLAFLY